MGGWTQLLSEDKRLETKSRLFARLSVFHGGFLVEEMVFNEITTGAQNDLEQATKLARRMITEFGMSEKLGPRTFGQKQGPIFLGRDIAEQRDYSEKIAQEIDEEILRFIEKAREKARQILLEKRDLLEQITQKLIDIETLEGEELKNLLGER